MTTDAQLPSLTVISSMATRHVLTHLTDAYERQSGTAVSVVSVGGVEAANRIRDGERFDIIVLASDALQRLGDAGHLDLGTKVDIARAKVAVAVKLGEPQRDVSSETSLRDTILRAKTIGYSTGPSGTRIIDLLKHWGVYAAMSSRLVEAPPGVPVGSLVADGRVEIGFQQLSELIHQPGIDIIGILPSSIAGETIFSAAISSSTRNEHLARDFLVRLSAPECDELKIEHGMEPA